MSAQPSLISVAEDAQVLRPGTSHQWQFFRDTAAPGGGTYYAMNENGVKELIGGAGMIGGAGTVNRIAKFTAPNTIGDSSFFDNGVSVALGTILPSASAFLQIDSTSQGFLVPRMTTVQRNAIVAPAEGLLIYNITTDFFNYFDGVSWLQIDTSTGGDVSGSGTTNFIPRWTDGPNSVLGDSIIRDNGTVAAVNRSVIATTTFSIQGADSGAVNYTFQTYNSTPTQTFGVRNDGYIYAGLASGNLTIGASSGFSTALSSNTFIGVEIGANAVGTGSDNTSVGHRSMMNLTTGQSNCAFGKESMFTNTTGSFNSSFGFDSLHDNSTGQFNCAFGREALKLFTGSTNSAFGNKALAVIVAGSDNAAFGSSAMLQATGGGQNTSIGTDSFNNATTGDNNTSLGYAAGFGKTTGNNNTYIGAFSGLTANTASGNVFLGFSAGRYNTDSNAFYVNNQDRTNTANEKSLSLMYGEFAATTPSQFLRVNANLGILTNTFGANADGVLAAVNGATEVSAAIANGIQLYSVDTAGDATATLGLYLEQVVEASAAFTQTDRLKIKINGVEYYIALDAV